MINLGGLQGSEWVESCGRLLWRVGVRGLKISDLSSGFVLILVAVVGWGCYKKIVITALPNFISYLTLVNTIDFFCVKNRKCYFRVAMILVLYNLLHTV